MKTYLEIYVPIHYDDRWFESLRRKLRSIPVIWQKDFYHITMAFIDDTPEDIDMRPVLDKYFKQQPPIEVTFDKLDVFTTSSETKVIYLTSTQAPERFLSLTENIRSELADLGCRLRSGFRLHVTLGRVKSPHVRIVSIRERINEVPMPGFKLSLTDVDYRVYRGDVLYGTKLI